MAYNGTMNPLFKTKWLEFGEKPVENLKNELSNLDEYFQIVNLQAFEVA